jgi:DNA-binding MarR family transcriptional regulator
MSVREPPPGPAALKRMPGHLIRRAQQASNAIFAEECGAHDLTSVQFAALFCIRSAGEIDATRLAEQIAFDRATIGDVVDRMESKGWVARAGSPTDRRVKLIRLTAQGERLLATVEPAVERVQARLLEPFAPEERPLVMALLTRLARSA